MSAPTSNRLGCFGIFIVVLLVVSLFFNVMFFSAGFFEGGDKKFQETVITKAAPQVKTKIAVIRLAGMITSMLPGYVGDSMVEDVKLQLKQALDDNEVRAIVLAIESPGGEVTASDMIYNAVKAARAKKPVVISMGSLAASGGYYIACGGSHIFANETTITGSIGVIMQSINYADAAAKIGVNVVTYKSGKFKDMLSGSRKVEPEEEAYIKANIMETYEKFLGIVVAERKVTADEAFRNNVADGRIISGKKAVADKLVDEIGDLDAAIAKAIQLGAAPGSVVVKYELPGIGRFLRVLGKAEQPRKIEVNIGPEQLSLKPGYQYLLPATVVP